MGISEQQLQLFDPADGQHNVLNVVNGRGEELCYREPCREVRQNGACFFTPYLIFPKLLSFGLMSRAPLVLQPLYCSAAYVVANHWHARMGGRRMWDIGKSEQTALNSGSRR